MENVKKHKEEGILQYQNQKNENRKLFYGLKHTDTDRYSFIVCIKTNDTQKDIAEDGETRFDASNYESKQFTDC